jgi:hypothetical protein
MNPDTTPTPRTDEQIWTTEYHHKHWDVVDMEFSREIERELIEKTNEVERLTSHLNQAIDMAIEAHEEIGKLFRGSDYVRIGMKIYQLKLAIK